VIPFSFTTSCFACADNSAAISAPSIHDVENQLLNNSERRESIFSIVALRERPRYDPAIEYRRDTIEVNVVLREV
jgi:hypothetical protein